MGTWLYLAPRRFLMLLVRGYRLFLSAWIGNVCRFTPTCSAYSLQSLEQHGAVAGTYLTLHRLGRCQPWCQGGHDPVPEQLSGWLTRFSDGRRPAASRPPSASPSFTSSEKTRT